jgi:hypothetical protein
VDAVQVVLVAMIVNAPVPAVLTTLGRAVKAIGPVAAALLEMVTRPVLVVALAGVVVNPGVGPLKVAVPLTTCKLNALEFPPVLATVTVWVPTTWVSAGTVSVAVICVSLTTEKLLTGIVDGPLPLTVRLVAAVNPIPVTVIGTVAPTETDAGLMAVMSGPTLNVTALLAVPLALVTVTLRAPFAALPAIVNVVVMVVAFTTVTAPPVTPLGLLAVVTVTELLGVKLVPVRVTAKLV